MALTRRRTSAAEQDPNPERAEVDPGLGPQVARGDGFRVQAEGERRVEREFDQQVIEGDHHAVREAQATGKDRDEDGRREENRLRIEEVDEEALAEGVACRFGTLAA